MQRTLIALCASLAGIASVGRGDDASQDAAPRSECAARDSAPRDSAPRDSAPRDSAPRDSAPRDSAPRDTAVGYVAIAGSEPFTELVLRRRRLGGLRLSGPEARRLRSVVGAEVFALGDGRLKGELRVCAFTVLRVDGVDAVDGVLTVERRRVRVVRAPSPPVTLRDVPPGLRALGGTRVWVTVDASGSVVGFGPIRERPPR